MTNEISAELSHTLCNIASMFKTKQTPQVHFILEVNFE